MQEKCNIAKWRLQTGYLEPLTLLPPHPSSPYCSGSSPASPTTAKRPSTELHSNSKRGHGDEGAQGLYISHAAFAVSLTRILSPVTVHRQWEIDLRSALIALLVS